MKKKTETTLKMLDDFCREHIEDYDEKVSIAWGYMDRMRCPLSMTGVLYDEICEVLEMYADDLEIDLDEFDEDDIEAIISV